MWRFQPSRFRDWFNTDKPSADLTMCLNSALKFTFYLTTVIAFTFQVNQVEGIRWINTPCDITMCAHETANLTWEYVREDNEDIQQIQWRHNSTTLIAYRGATNGLHIDPKYHGRVEESGVNGILLKNITAKDIGSYSLRIIVSLIDTTVIQSRWLNVIDAEAVTIPKWCTCDRLPTFPEWQVGQHINDVINGCSLEINSSHCCIKRPTNRCNDNNPQDLCHPFRKSTLSIENVTPVRNTNQITENDTQNRLVLEGPKHKDTEVITVILIAFITIIIICVFSVVLNVFFILRYWKKRQLCRKKGKMANTEQAEQDEGQETSMLAERETSKHLPYHGTQRRLEESNTSLQRRQLLSCSVCAKLCNYIEVLENVLYQQKSQGILDEKMTTKHRTRSSTWTKSQIYSAYIDTDKHQPFHANQTILGESNKSVQQSQLLSCSICAKLRNYIEVLENLLYQQKSQGILDEKVTSERQPMYERQRSFVED